ncbi:MAG TPA: sterol desaturase family protein [Xanthobacteraceae bacterium]|jgi:sterol desaturase/sphingolipid hydroxylase (fatty acid hydroxylase superfamily)
MLANLLHVLVTKVVGLTARSLPSVLIMVVLCTVLACFSRQACNPGKVWWRNRGLLLDIGYYVTLKCLAPYLRMGLMIAIAMLCMTFVSAQQLDDYFRKGGGLFASYSFWWQVAFHLLIADFLLYWLHRLFHGARLWRYHAIHHSAEDVDWTTAYRFHPLNSCFGPYLVDALMLYLGIAPSVLLALVPFQTIAALFVHTNLNWTFGPLKYLVATPVFHRWHHTMRDEGGNSNFAPTFPLWDLLFGTFYMPPKKLPVHYGVDDPTFPSGFFEQLAFPFRRRVPVLGAGPSAIESAAPRSQ